MTPPTKVLELQRICSEIKSRFLYEIFIDAHTSQLKQLCFVWTPKQEYTFRGEDCLEQAMLKLEELYPKELTGQYENSEEVVVEAISPEEDTSD